MDLARVQALVTEVGDALDRPELARDLASMIRRTSERSGGSR